ncbi:MAG: outer membrane protein assembly factor BamB family protein, partial [Candidatus Latescibacterota bacterium]
MWNRIVWSTAVLHLSLFLASAPCAAPAGSDWPMWRYDAARSASSPHALPDELHLLWVRQYPERIPVWDDPLNRDLMPYDTVFEPVVSGKTLILGFNDADKVSAIDTESGREKWTFYTAGPLRLPPAIWNGKVYCTSDDGSLYCLNLSNGSLAWKFSGAPSERRILGNSRLISTWPSRGGAVVKDGTVYFSAGIWPFMGVFLYALDAATGKALWVNEGEGARYMLQPHNAPSFAGIAPQGALALAGNRLIVPGGRSVPACFDPETGKFLYYELAANAKSGGSFVAANDNLFSTIP